MRILAAIAVLILGLSSALGQALIQSGPWTPGHAPGYSGTRGAVPLVQDSGPAGGGGPGLTEGLYIAPPPAGGGPPPFANTGTGPFGTNWCDYDAPITSGAYHYFCLSPDAAGGGLLAYGAVGATSEPLSFYINGVKYNFPVTLSGVLGPVSSTIGDTSCWNNTQGSLLSDCGPYQTHAALIAGVTAAPPNANSISQLGYTTAGDGGFAIYDWNTTWGAYCPGGTALVPVPADGNVCILPSTQLATAAGRYILRMGKSIDVRQIGVAAGGQDTSPFLASLLSAAGAAPVQNAFGGTPGMPVEFPTIPVQNSTEYYFSQSLDWTRSSPISCGRSGSFQDTSLVFAPGIDGLIQDSTALSPDALAALGSDIKGCRIASLGVGSGTMISGSTSVTSVLMTAYGSIPATTWGIGDGIISATTFVGPHMPAGNPVLAVPQGDYVTNVSGSTLTLNAAAIAPASSGSAAIYRLPAALTYSVNTYAPATTTATSSWTTSSTTIPVVGCGGINPGEFVTDTTPTTPTNIGRVAYCSGTTLGIIGTASTASSGSGDALSIASDTVTMTGGPQILMQPGDPIWLDAYVYGAIVYAAYNQVNNTASGNWTTATTVTLTNPCPTGYINNVYAPVMDTTANVDLGAASCSGSTLTLAKASSGSSGDVLALPVASNSLPLATAAGNQMLLISGVQMVAPNVLVGQYIVNSSLSHTGGNGKMWKLPSGIDRRVQAKAHDNSINGWPIGLRMASAAGSVPTTNATASIDVENAFRFNLIGRFVSGGNTGASSSIMNFYATNHVTDIMELGSIGSAYLGDNTNSVEGSATAYGIEGQCASANASSFTAMYASGFVVYANGQEFNAYCMSVTGAIDAPPVPPSASYAPINPPLFIAPLQSHPPDSNLITSGTFNSNHKWQFQGPNFTTLVATSATASGAAITIATPSWIFAGLNITDLTNAVIPASTTISTIVNGTITMSNSVTGGGIQIGDTLVISNVIANGAPCVGIGGGLESQVGIFFDKNCGTQFGWQMQYNGFHNAWEYSVAGGATAMAFAGADYLGLGPSTQIMDFPPGIMMGAYGAENTFGVSATKPTGAYHTQGDTAINTAGGAGGYGLWIDTAAGANFSPAALIASESTGKAWPAAAVQTTIAALPSCTGAVVGSQAVITNGIASPTYLQAVSSTGTSVRKVFCDNSGWLYD